MKMGKDLLVGSGEDITVGLQGDHLLAKRHSLGLTFNVPHRLAHYKDRFLCLPQAFLPGSFRGDGRKTQYCRSFRW